MMHIFQVAFIDLAVFAALCLGLAALAGLRLILERLKVIAGSLSMIAVALDEKCADAPDERVIMRQLRNTIYHGIVDGAFQSRQ